MAMDVKVIVGKAPEGAIDLGEFEELDDFVDVLKRASAEGGETHARFRTPPRVKGELPFTLVDAMERLVELASAGNVGMVRVYVDKADTAATLEKRLQPDFDGRRTWSVGGWRVVLRTGDLTSVLADALVNASNCQLRLGSGVSGALRRACGSGLQQEMNRIGGVALHGIAVTGAHDLARRGVRHILHVPTVSGEEEVVKKALENVLARAEAMGLRSVAIPGLGTGTGGLAMETFAALCVDALRASAPPSTERTVIFVAYDKGAFDVMERAFERGAGFKPVTA